VTEKIKSLTNSAITDTGRSLAITGREVMIKLMMQSILTLYMSIFLSPRYLGDEIQKLENSFRWGWGGNNKRVVN